MIYVAQTLSRHFLLKDNDLILKKMTEIMLNKGYLFKNIVYISTSHNNKILKKYLKDFEKTILQLKKIYTKTI